MKLADPEYMQEVMVRSNANEKYRALAKGQYESYTMVLDAEPECGVMEAVIAGFDCRDGEIVEVWQGKRPTTFTLSAPYHTWVKILRGQLGPMKAITMRHLQTQGPFLQLLKGGARVLYWVDILRTIPTTFDGNFGQVP